MTSIDDRADLDHAYFQALEETFIRLRGTPLLLSPADWQIAKGWRRKGIPLSLITRTLEDLFARESTDRGMPKARSLRYCARAVEADWIEAEGLAASGLKTNPTELDVRARLEALAEALRESGPDLISYREEVLGCEGSSSSVEAALARIDERMMTSVIEGLDRVELGDLEKRAEEALEDLKSRLADEEIRRPFDRLVKQLVRRSRQLPVLSLFAPEAAVDKPG